MRGIGPVAIAAIGGGASFDGVAFPSRIAWALTISGVVAAMILAVVVFRYRAERRAHSAALADERASAHDILAAMTVDGLIAFDRAGDVIHVNAVAARMFGRPREALIGHRISPFAPVASREELGALARRALADRVPVTTVHLVPEPWDRWFEITFFPGASGGLVVHLRDVDARERAEVERRLATERAAERARDLRHLADAMPQIVWTAGPDGAPEFLNARWSAFSGFERGHGGSPVDTPLLHPDDAPRCRAAWTQAVATGVPYQVEHRFWDRSADAWRWFLSRALPAVDDDGRVVHWYGTSTDIDDHKRAQEERDASLAATQEALRAREEFLSIASHELRTPLTTLSLHADLLAHRLSRGDVPEAFAWVPGSASAIVTQAVRMTQLVDTLLDVSRISVGRVRLRPEPIDLADVAREVVDRLNDEEQAPIRFEAQGRSDGQWDRLRVEQIVVNLVSNAIKYGQRQPIDVRVAEGDGSIQISVRDRGIGIEGHDRERIFERFERAVSDRNFGGLGLGLWISREIADAMGGTLSVESAPGEGSTFTLELPR